MKITFHGAAQTVTGSQHLIEVNGHKILLDCGLYQGKRKIAQQRNRTLPFNATELDAVILSHAHIDHSGNLPNLINDGYHGPIYATPATAHLSNIMLLDSAHIQEQDAEYLNKKLVERGELPVEPLYTQEDAALVAQNFSPQDYHKTFEVAPGVTGHFVDAGHILGSAAVALDIEQARSRGGGKLRLWFSGDIGRRNLPLIRDPEMPERPDVMIMECTYGDKPHNDPQAAIEELRTVVKRTVQRGGKIIIPSFAVGRTQDLVYNLHVLMTAGDLPRVPVVVDSPLAVNVSDIYKKHPECFDRETYEFIAQDKHRTILGFDNLTYTRSVEQSKAINDRKGPMIIISASGMAETGRILHHLKNNIEDARNTILIVSWQAPDTLGRRLADREERVRIFGDWYQRRAEVATIGGLSAHAGQNFLLEYAQAACETVQEIFLVHGESGPAAALQKKIADLGPVKINYPALHQTVEI
jgi:metallo-beta-lactamase family protein